MNATDLALWKYFRTTAFGNDTAQDIPVERTDYNTGGNIIYEGVAPWGSLSSDAKWIITRVTYDGNGNMTLKEHSKVSQIWDNRTTTTYG